jgi:hypothetical protein
MGWRPHFHIFSLNPEGASLDIGNREGLIGAVQLREIPLCLGLLELLCPAFRITLPSAAIANWTFSIMMPIVNNSFSWSFSIRVNTV